MTEKQKLAEALHIMPIGDLRDHSDDKKCWCNPVYDDGLYIHNAMDGREKFETGERKYS